MPLRIETASKTYFVISPPDRPHYRVTIVDTDTGDTNQTEWSSDELVNMVAGVTPDKVGQASNEDVPPP